MPLERMGKFPEGSVQLSVLKAILLEIVLRLIRLCRGMIAKKFVRAEILLFRNEIFSETKLVSPQFMK